VARVSAAEAAVQVLVSEGVELAFGVPGVDVMPFFEALDASPVRHYLVRHSEGGAHAAEGYSRATGRVGVLFGSSSPVGPGMITGLSCAMSGGIPLLCIVGQEAGSERSRQEYRPIDVAEVARPLTKWAVTVTDSAQIPWIFRQAFYVMKSGRPGPVLVSFPRPLQQKAIEYDPSLDRPLVIHRPRAHPQQIDKALDMLAATERPLIIAGGGVVSAEASDLLVEFAEITHTPVSPTLMGWGSMPDDHPQNAGRIGLQAQHRYGNETFLQSDFVLGIGNRWAPLHTGSLDVYTRGRKFVHVDIDPTQIGRVFGPDLGIVSDARYALEMFVERARERKQAGLLRHHTRWVAECSQRKWSMLRQSIYDDVPIKPQRVFQEIDREFGDETRFVTANGLYQIAAAQIQNINAPRSYILSAQSGPPGWELSACIGTKLADPEREVVGIVGDYSFQFLIEELAVAAQYRLPFVLVLLNNSCFGILQADPSHPAYDRKIALGFDNINSGEGGPPGVDHVKAAEAFGCRALRVTEPDQLGAALVSARELARESRVPVVLEVITERNTAFAMGPEIDRIVEHEDLDVSLEPERTLVAEGI
jgi:tartronate-semialdehyde synthase